MKTFELTGPALDWATAKADGKTPKIDCTSFRGAFKYCIYLGWSYDNEGRDSIIEYKPSTDWARGGPIIEREKIEIRKGNPLYFPKGNELGEYYEPLWLAGKQHGQTLLIAAMRCYVASKLGDTIDIPKELT